MPLHCTLEWTDNWMLKTEEPESKVDDGFPLDTHPTLLQVPWDYGLWEYGMRDARTLNSLTFF
jgi:hypothetical protein